jgi:hypothetical protein
LTENSDLPVGLFQRHLSGLSIASIGSPAVQAKADIGFEVEHVGF